MMTPLLMLSFERVSSTGELTSLVTFVVDAVAAVVPVNILLGRDMLLNTGLVSISVVDLRDMAFGRVRKSGLSMGAVALLLVVVLFDLDSVCIAAESFTAPSPLILNLHYLYYLSY